MLSRVPITFEMVQVPLFDQLLRVAEPHIGTMGQARNLQQVGKGFRLALEQHLPDKGGTHFQEWTGCRFRTRSAPPSHQEVRET